MPTTAEPFRREFGWEPRYPTYRDGLDAVVERWHEGGTLGKTGDGYEWRGDRPNAADTAGRVEP